MKKISSIEEIIDKYSTFFFDMTGVLWREEKSGQIPIKQTIEALNLLSKHQKNIFFISNNSVTPRTSLCSKIKNYGFDSIELNQIYTSGYLASKYIKSLPNIKKIYAIGMQGLYDELSELNIPIIKSEDHTEKGILKMNQLEFDKIDYDKDINCVCIGIDLNFNYYKLCYASLCINQNQASFIACDDDGYIMVGDKRMPIAGSMVQSIQKVVGIKPEICGKPNPFVINSICNEKNYLKKECIMIGDSIESDLTLAKSANIESLILLSGVTTEEELMKLELGQQPTYYADFL